MHDNRGSRLVCGACGIVCGEDWYECWAHARLHGRVLGIDWACEVHAHAREHDERVHAGGEVSA